MQSSAIIVSSSRVNTFPVGLCGEFTMIGARRRTERRAQLVGSNAHSGWRSVTYLSVAPARIASGE